MDIEEVQKLKFQTENDIQRLLLAFVGASGVSVNGIDIEVSIHKNMEGREFAQIGKVTLDVRL